MSAVIICNGCIEDYGYLKKYFEDADFVISVDGGARHARRFGIIPDVLLGDFDSISGDDLEYFKCLGTETVKFPAEKDMTDTELAVQTACQRGHNSITFIGGLGSRIDHSLANIFLLKSLLDRGIKGRLVNESNEVTIIKDFISIKSEADYKVTLLPMSERVEGVTTKGLYYPLVNATIEMGSTWGVSNEFSADTAEVSIKSGILLVIKSRD